jgi:glucan phosphoethanolaminetransferase (alkaline phosphatase superfamily)
MSEPLPWRHAVWSLTAELSAWVLIVGPFLYLYSGHPGGGLQSVAPHLGRLCLVWLAVVCLRLAAWRCWPDSLRARLTATLLLGTVLISLLIYYSLVLVGLWSWGRVISWELIHTYVGQVPALAESLGLSMGLIAAVAAAGVVAMLVLVNFAVANRDWTQWLASKSSGLVLATVVVGGLVGVAMKSYTLTIDDAVDEREPISLTFLMGKNIDVSGHLASRVNVSPDLLAQARADRETYLPGKPSKRPNIVLVVVDALRSDRMTLYGHDRTTTPYLMSLQRQGQVRFAQRAMAVCPESFCGLLAIARSKPLHKITGQDLSLHEVLKRHGYSIEMILSGDHTHFYGLRQAYGAVDRYADGSSALGNNSNDDEFVVQRAKALPPWDGQPTLLQFHLMSAHRLGLRDPKFAPFQPARPYQPWTVNADNDRESTRLESRNHYDNGVLQMDDVLRRIVDALTERNYMRNTILVLTGDHGEGLGEHGEYGHAKSVFEPAMRVPLVFAGFGTPPPSPHEQPAGPASQLDIGPTLLNELGIPAPRLWEGFPLQRRLPPRQLPLQQGHLVGVYDSSEPGRTLKYVRHVRTGVEQVFDVDADPQEQRDLRPMLDAKRLANLRQATLPISASVPN